MTNNVVFGKNIENVRKQEILNLSQQKGVQYCSVSEPYCHTTKFFQNRKKKI